MRQVLEEMAKWSTVHGGLCGLDLYLGVIFIRGYASVKKSASTLLWGARSVYKIRAK